MTLNTAIERLQFHALACTDVKMAPTDPPENAGVYPFAIAYPESGTLQGESGNLLRGVHTVAVEFHVNRTVLPLAVSQSRGYIEEYGYKLACDPTLNGAVDTIQLTAEQQVTYEFGRLEWAGVETIGVRFHIPLKIRKSST